MLRPIFCIVFISVMSTASTGLLLDFTSRKSSTKMDTPPILTKMDTSAIPTTAAAPTPAHHVTQSKSEPCPHFLAEATRCFTRQHLDMTHVLKGMLLIGDFQASTYRYQCQHVRAFKKADKCLMHEISKCSKTAASRFPSHRTVSCLLNETCHKHLNFTCFDKVEEQQDAIASCVNKKYDMDVAVAKGEDVRYARCRRNQALVQCEVDVLEKCDYRSAHILESQFRMLYPQGCVVFSSPGDNPVEKK